MSARWTNRLLVAISAFVLCVCAFAVYTFLEQEATEDRVDKQTVILERSSACRENLNSPECKESITAAMRRCVTVDECARLVRLASQNRKANGEPRAGGNRTANQSAPESDTASAPSSVAPQGSTPTTQSAPPESDSPAPSPSPDPEPAPPAPSPPAPPPEPPTPPQPSPPSNPDRGPIRQTVDDVTDAVCSVNALGVRVCL